MKKIINKQTFCILLFCFLLSFLLCFSPFAQGYGHGWDSAIYAAIGNAINKGRILYTGIVDNKGPLLYFIDALGLAINYKFGIFFIEFVFLFVGTIFAYKTALLITKDKKWISLISVIFSMLLLVYTIDGGNYTEEYALLFTNIATYYIVKFLLSSYQIKWYELIIIGGCFSLTFLLRANLCALFVCEILFTLFYLLKDKEYKVLFKCILYILLGICLFLTPFLIYLVSNGALKECLNLVYLNVVGSFSSVSLLDRFNKVCGLIEITNKSNVFTLTLLSFVLFIANKKKSKEEIRILLIGFSGIILNLYVNSLTGGVAWAYTHYYISFVPICILIIAWLFNYVYIEVTNEIKSKNLNTTIITILLFLVILRPSIDLLKLDVQRFGMDTPDHSSMEKYILDNSNEDDTIQIIGVNDSIYYPVNRIPTSKHLYFVAGFSENRKKKDATELANDLINAKKKSKIIMMPSGNINDLDFVNSLNNKEDFIELLKDDYIYNADKSNEFDCNVYELK